MGDTLGEPREGTKGLAQGSPTGSPRVSSGGGPRGIPGSGWAGRPPGSPTGEGQIEVLDPVHGKLAVEAEMLALGEKWWSGSRGETRGHAKIKTGA